MECGEGFHGIGEALERYTPDEFVSRYSDRKVLDDSVARNRLGNQMRDLLEDRSPFGRIAVDHVSSLESVVEEIRRSNERLQKKVQELQKQVDAAKQRFQDTGQRLSGRQADAFTIAETQSARALAIGMKPLQTLLGRGAPSSLLAIDKRLASKITEELGTIYSAMSREIARIADGFAEQSAIHGAPSDCESKILNNLPICMNYCEGAD